MSACVKYVLILQIKRAKFNGSVPVEIVSHSSIYFVMLSSIILLQQTLFSMSNLNNDLLLESLFEQVKEENPTLSESEQIELTKTLFEDMIQ